MDDFKAAAAAILQQHGHPAGDLHYLGAGAQSVCYGAGDVALLINLGETAGDVRPLNPYPLQRWLTAQAVGAGVKTAAILATGDHPHPYALMRRAPGSNASELKDAAPARIAAWFRCLGAEVHKINQIHVTGFGEFVPADQPAEPAAQSAPDSSGQQAGYRGRYPTWSAYLDACIAKYLFMGPLNPQARSVRDLYLAQQITTAADLAKVAARLEAARRWDVQPVLVHYDNRLANLMVDVTGEGEALTLVDWGLAYAGIGLPQELIKVTEAPHAAPPHDPMAAFLEGYGVPPSEWAEAIDRGTLMLVLDGLAMSYAWAEDLAANSSANPTLPSSYHGSLAGIRGWLQSIHRICAGW